VNNIVIGLGGTGGKIIKFLKKKIELDPHINKSNIYIDYLYVDSDMSLIQKEYEWKILGKDISLKNSNIVYLKYQDMNVIFNNPDNYRHIINWLGDRNYWKPILKNFTNMIKIYGQQKRRLGRFLFASNIDEFTTSVNNMVQSLQSKTETTKTSIYICSGLAGGTGSGSLIDTIVQVKKLYPNSNILLFLFLPEKNPSQKDTGNYHSNAYATLKELNALSTGNWKPHDLTSPMAQRTKHNNFFKKAYIITNENSNNIQLNSEYGQPEKLLADFIHKRVIGASDYLGRIEDSENIRAGAEGIDKRPIRARSFATFGMAKIIFPKQEIMEYMTYKSSYSLLLSLLYNNWNEQKSTFVDEDKNLNINQVLNDSFKTTIKFTDKTLTLAEGVLENEDKFMTFGREWDNHLRRVKESQRNQGLKVNEKFINVANMFETFYENRFRGKDIGVVKFFKNAETDANNRADAIIQLIERHLFDAWIYREKYSIKNLEDIINALFKLISTEIDRLTEMQTKALDNIARFEKEKNDIAERFRSAGVFTNKAKIYENYENTLKKYYLSMTHERAFNYAVSVLLPLIKTKMSLLLNSIQETKINFTELKSDMNEKYSSRLKVTINDKTVYKVFNKRLIDDVLDRTIVHNKIQHGLLKTTIQQQIRDRLGADNLSFQELNDKFNRYSFLDFLEKTLSIDIVAQVHQDTNITNKNIIDELEMQYRGNDSKLNKLVVETMRGAEEFLPFNTTEVGRHSPITNSTITAKAERQILVLPLSNSKTINHNFRAKLKNIFDKQKKSNTTVDHTVDDLYNNRTSIEDIHINSNEITITKIVSTFPLRMIEKVKFLKEIYSKAHINNPNLDLEIHLEGTGDNYPDLFLEDISINNYEEIFLSEVVLDDKSIEIIDYHGNGLSKYFSEK